MDSDMMAANGATTLTFPPTDCLPKRTVVVGSANNAASSYLMAVRNIGVIVKCSGSKHVMKPAVYGTNNGRAVEVFQFPVNYKGLQDMLQPLLLTMKRVWLEDQAVLFHCNGGIHRAPAGYAIAMANINCTSIKDELDYLRQWRPRIHETYKYCFDEGYDIDTECSKEDYNLVWNLLALDPQIPRSRPAEPNSAEPATASSPEPYRARFQKKRVLQSWTPSADLLFCDQYMAIRKDELIQVRMNDLEEGWAWARSDDAAGWIPPSYVEGGCLEDTTNILEVRLRVHLA